MSRDAVTSMWLKVRGSTGQNEEAADHIITARWEHEASSERALLTDADKFSLNVPRAKFGQIFKQFAPNQSCRGPSPGSEEAYGSSGSDVRRGENTSGCLELHLGDLQHSFMDQHTFSGPTCFLKHLSRGGKNTSCHHPSLSSVQIKLLLPAQPRDAHLHRWHTFVFFYCKVELK